MLEDKKQRLLEIGCGRGLQLEERVNLSGKTYYGLDIRPEFLDWGSKEKALIAGDGNFLPFSDQSFDEVVCSHTLEHMEDYNTLMPEIYRVLKKGGRVEINVPHPDYEEIMGKLSPDYHSPKMHLRVISHQELVELVKPYFEIVRVSFRRNYRASLNIRAFQNNTYFEEHTGIIKNTGTSSRLRKAVKKMLNYMEDSRFFSPIIQNLYSKLGIPPYETHLIAVKI